MEETNRILTYDEVGELLDEVLDEMDPAIFSQLTGGVNLSADTKLHPQRCADDYFILGEYVYDGLGSYIMLYYGSMCHIYESWSKEDVKGELISLIHHELTHHWERLAGERDLAIEDQKNLRRYWQLHGVNGEKS